VWYSIGKKDDPNSQWIQDDITQEASWFIKHKSSPGTKLYIRSFGEGAPHLEEVHSHEEMKGNFLLSLTLGILNIKYPYKMITKERILAPNTPLLVLGNVYSSKLDDNIHLSKPEFGIYTYVKIMLILLRIFGSN
jgi:hypothetical protein